MGQGGKEETTERAEYHYIVTAQIQELGSKRVYDDQLLFRKADMGENLVVHVAVDAVPALLTRATAARLCNFPEASSSTCWCIPILFALRKYTQPQQHIPPPPQTPILTRP